MIVDTLVPVIVDSVVVGFLGSEEIGEGSGGAQPLPLLRV